MREEMALYKQAAAEAIDFNNTHSVRSSSSAEENESLIAEFRKKYSPDVLKAIADKDLLRYCFITADGNNDSLCYHLEFNPAIKRAFGSIAGGSSYKYGLFQRQEDRKWVTGAGKAPQVLSEAEALELGKSIRDTLVKACDVVISSSLDSREDYDRLDDALNASIGKYAFYAWIQKYLHLIFPEKFVGWYATDWLKHLLYGFGIEPSTKYYGMNGQLALIKRESGYHSSLFKEICYEMFGGIKKFYRLGCSAGDHLYSDEWKRKGIVAIGWPNTGDLLEYVKNGVFDKDSVAAILEREYYSGDKKTASRKAGEIKTFFEASQDAVIVVMDGLRIKGFVDGLTPYFYDDSSDMPHQKRGSWHSPFSENELLPEEEGLQTTCVELKKSKNLLYFYDKYYNRGRMSSSSTEQPDCNESYKLITGFQSKYARNRIVFGAPGTGKSYTLNKEKQDLICNGGVCERVTFHPDYSYANFVGTYKPVPAVANDGSNIITYRFVPGPFMRVYVAALKNSREAAALPHVLLIEEINRANVAAVFGDVFQLLDRNDDNISEYPICTSEDIKAYLAAELGGHPDDYSEIGLPDNMFIWATMNSADQGVFPMDTAFKRRWDFTYIGIDTSESEIKGKTVTLGTGTNARVVEWNELRRAINDKLSSFKINEDKLLGPYFLSRKIIPPIGEIDRDRFIEAFKSKVLMYLFDDAAKQKRPSLFAEGVDTTKYSEVCKAFDIDGVLAFCSDISGKFTVIPEQPEGTGDPQ